MQALAPARSRSPAPFSRSISERPPTPPLGDLRRASSDAPGRQPPPLQREDSATNLAEVRATAAHYELVLSFRECGPHESTNPKPIILVTLLRSWNKPAPVACRSC